MNTYKVWEYIDEKYQDFQLMNFRMAKDIFFDTYGNHDKFIENLKNGVLEVYAELAHAEWVYDIEDEKFNPFEDFYDIITGNQGLNYDSYIQRGVLLIDKSFWSKEHLKETQSWEKTKDFFVNYYFSNWENKEFGHAWANTHFGSDGSVGKVIFYNCLISERTVFLLTGWKKNAPSYITQVETEKQQKTSRRASQYNWEASFADVAAWLYHDADIPDINALGVQKQIIDVLRQSFENRKLTPPSDSSLKSKANIIMGSLRSNKH